MSTLSPSDLDRLEALARAATPGKRTALPDATIPNRCLGIYVGPIPEDEDEPGRLATEDATSLVVTDSGFYPPRAPDADFIAACDRETILALVDEIHGWRVAAGIERTAGVDRCIIEDVEPPSAPLVGAASPAPPVAGRVGFYIERIVPAADMDGVGDKVPTLSLHVKGMAAKMAGSLEEGRLSASAYRIRISIEPEP